MRRDGLRHPVGEVVVEAAVGQSRGVVAAVAAEKKSTTGPSSHQRLVRVESRAVGFDG